MAARRQLAPRPAPNTDVESPNRGSLGRHLLKPGVHADVRKPSWNGTETVFRPYPSIDYEDPTKFYPYRLDPGGKDRFGNWIKRYDAAWGVGNPAITFLLRDPDNSQRTFDPWMTPLGVLYRAINDACKAGRGQPEWYPIREGATGKGKALRAPSSCYMMQGYMPIHMSKRTYQPGQFPAGYGLENRPLILLLSSATGESLIDYCNMENDGFRGDPADFDSRYVHGDLVGLDSGRFIHFFQQGFDPRERYASAPAAPRAVGQHNWEQGSGGKGDDDAIGFDMFFASSFSNCSATLNDSLPDGTSHADMVREKFLYWEDALYFPTYEEQGHLLSEVFPASAILYAFADHPDWIPENLRRRAVNATSATVPAGVPTAGTPSGGANFGGATFGGRQPQQPGQSQQPGQAQQPATAAPPAETADPWAGVPGRSGRSASSQDSVVPAAAIPEDGDAAEGDDAEVDAETAQTIEEMFESPKPQPQQPTKTVSPADIARMAAARRQNR